MKHLPVLLISLFAALHVRAQDKAKLFDSLFSYMYNNEQFNGNVLIAEGGKVIFEKSYGYADIQTKQKLNRHSVFELASVSKQFTAMAILQLMEARSLQLTDSLSKYFPELNYPGITVRHLLTHTSGLPDYMALFKEHWDKKLIAGNQDMIDLLAKHHPPALFTPGDKYEYSNTGYVLLASIIEKVSGKSFGDFLNTNIFRPLKMHRTRVYNTRRSGDKIKNYAYGFVIDEKTNKYVLPDSLPSSDFVYYLDKIVGDGTVNSTATDLLKWDRALYQNTLISQHTLKEAFSPYRLNNDSLSNYGYGWELQPGESPSRVVWHNGSWPGYYTFIYRSIEQDKTIIFLRNARRPAKVTGFSEAIIDILFDRQYTLPVIVKP